MFAQVVPLPIMDYSLLYLSCSWTSSSGLPAKPYLISLPWFSSNIYLSGYHPLIFSPSCTAAVSSPLQFSDSCPKLLLLSSSSVHVFCVSSVWSFLLCAAYTQKREHGKHMKKHSVFPSNTAWPWTIAHYTQHAKASCRGLVHG